MIKMIALYKKPADVAEFEKRYFEEHLPLANKMPGLKKVEISRIVGSPRGESEYYLMAQLYFDNKESMMTALNSPESKEAGKVLMSFAKDITTMMFAEPEEKMAMRA
jgi:uncharacterized protein (TIGR02118 family)